jgi:hypothetical protein
MNEWQRRYNESIRRHRAAAEPVNGEDMALVATGCVPGWIGLALTAASGVVFWWRRRRRSARS